jgi:hypothetical protein
MNWAMLDSCYSIAHPEIVFEQFEGDLVVLDLRSGRYFGFNAVGAATWAALMGGARASDIVAAGLDERLLTDFLNTVLREGIAIRTEGPGAPVSETFSALLRTNSEAPGIEAFDDLADLMMADPIHDVDADMGWPHRPKDA